LITQISEGIDAIYSQNSRWIWTRFLKSSIACENKTNLGGFQVQNVIFLDCPTMIALDFYASYGCFKFGLFMFQKGQKTCAS
jgi:hypothetical protein